MLKIRLIRGGKKGNPHYKIGIIDSRTKRNGFFIQLVGFFNPKTKDFKLKVNVIFKYLKCGVQPTQKIKYFLLTSHLIFNI